ncbi:hypothetical protein INT48_006533 [Thamnidium elegans]|uniref:Uncharacterized protein n=1 Tax=Thamnidium elegans TaxID=101142 RepID=A0A8H7SVP0_9FUNG|nr:hypothetical protein INT48_006533 [Thamnidium elegans]
MPKVKTKTPKYNKRLLFRDDCFSNKKRRDRRLAAKSSSAGNMEIQSKKSINTSPQRSTVTSDITGDFTLPTIPTIPIYSLLGDGFYENDDMDADWNDLPEFATEAEAVNTNEESSKKRSGREGVLNYTWNKYKDIIRNAYLTSINFESIIVMDACFQLKRYKKKGEDTGLKPYPLSIEESMYRSEDDVLPYDVSNNKNGEGEAVYVVCFGECCGRHGSPYILTDVMKGKGKKYCLYSVNQINERLNQEINTSGIPPSPIDIMYDICCLTRKLLEKKYPFLNERGSRFAVNIFHAYAHIWECQIEYHPDYKQGWGLTDGGEATKIIGNDESEYFIYSEKWKKVCGQIDVSERTPKRKKEVAWADTIWNFGFKYPKKKLTSKVGNRLAAKIQASILIAIKKARDYIRKYNSTLPDSNDPDAVRIPKEVVTQLQRDRTGALAEASGFSMNDGTTMWHAWCRSKEEVEIIKGEVFRTLKFADMYLDRLNEIVNGSDTYYDITRGAIEFIKLVDLPFARGWKRRTYDAVINDISDGGITMEDEENIIEGGDLESDDDKGSDVEEDLSLEETEDVL